MKKSFFSLIILIFSLTLFSCVTVSDNELNGEYYSDKDEVLFNLDKGMIEFYNQDYEGAIENLSVAEDKISEYYAKSISQNIEAFLTNDYALDYPGEDYEDIYINIFKALSYYLNDQWEEGFHELNAYKRKADFLGQKHVEELEFARKEAQMNNSNQEDSVIFHDSALAEYLFMLYYRSIYDKSQVEYAGRMLKDVFLTSPKIYDFDMPASIEEELKVNSYDTRLNFVVCSGVSAYKEEIKFRYSSDYSIALPMLVIPDEKVVFIDVIAKNTATGKEYYQYLEKIEDLGNIAKDVFQSREDLILMKAVARSITKAALNSTATVTGATLAQSDDPTISLIGQILYVTSYAGRYAADQNERADLRHSRYLPGRADVGGLNVKPGKYDITINYRNKHDRIIYTDTITDFDVKAGRLNLVTSSSTLKEKHY